MHQYRTHNCGELKTANINNKVKISGWINRKRDHGGLLFLDLRDHFGVTQCVISRDHKEFSKIESIKVESVISITGLVLERSKDTINKKLSTGLIEVNIQDFDVLSSLFLGTTILPLPLMPLSEILLWRRQPYVDITLIWLTYSRSQKGFRFIMVRLIPFRNRY